MSGEGAPGLADVLPAVAAALGVGVRTPDGSPPRLELAEARAAVVVLVDGLGDHLLRRRGGHAPYLRRLAAGGASVGRWAVQVGFPTTTATSMGTFGTGELPGSHGLVGLDVLDPGRDVLFNELAWDPEVDPHVWQPVPTVFEQLARAGVEVVRIGPRFFDGSGLTEAALRGGRFVAGESLSERVDAAVEALHRSRRLRGSAARCLVYLYWGDVDKAGHVFGSDSWEWGESLAHVDGALRELVRRVGPQTLLVVTADHGMVDVAMSDRLDLAAEPDLAAGVRHVGGEPRAVQLYCHPGAAADVAAAWHERLGTSMEIILRDDAVRAGWFGPVATHVLPRIGDVIAVARDPVAVVDSRTARPELLRLIGLHGARTAEESLVPVVATTGTALRW